ncbi:hypothetical protein [Syntrophomonas palmitatica]|uniref:hypothetical protein n=1 Tax=Syntrophomonas palmitatica TaxID=402877 RepID=UPI000A41D187|nr:hypothetical protein [Syntrophomonas palmitatica]
MAVGQYGQIFVSPDGENWGNISIEAYWLSSVAFGNNMFVAVGADGHIFTSDNAKDC